MKYIIVAIFVFIVLSFKSWSLVTDEIVVDERTSSDTSGVAIHDLLNNGYSDLIETKRLDQTIEQFMDQWHIKGASLAVMKDGKLVYCKGYGFADEEKEVKTDVNHIFRIASVSKLITAVGIMRLVEEGKISLTDRVFGANGILNDTVLYAPITDPRVKNITIEHLLRHQGGFSLRHGDPMFNPLDIAQKMHVAPPADLNTIIKFVLSKRLGFTPGAGTSYSNVGFGILTKVIEKVSGENYEHFIHRDVLIPAGCYDMHLGHNLYKNHYLNEVRYYEQSDAELVQACDGRDTLVHKCNGGNNIEELYGAGGWVASPTELLRLLSAIDGDDAHPDILGKHSIAVMTKSMENALPIGWMNTNSQGDWWRTGTLAGTSAMLKRQTDGFCWAFITNTSTWSGSKFPHKIEYMMQQAMNRVKAWPDRNLFDPAYCRFLENEKGILATGQSSRPVNQLPDHI